MELGALFAGGVCFAVKAASQPACVVQANCHYVTLPGFVWCVLQFLSGH